MANYSQREIARAAEIDERSVRRWQRGEPIKPITARRIARALVTLEKAPRLPAPPTGRRTP